VLPPVPERQPESITPPERTGKSGGNNTFYYIKKKCCHHPAERPVHSGFSSKGGSSGSTFAKL